MALKLVKDDGTVVKIPQCPTIEQLRMIEDSLFRHNSGLIPEAKKVASELLTEEPHMSTRQLMQALKEHFNIRDRAEFVIEHSSTLSASASSMIKNMFKYYPEQVPKATKIAEEYLAKHPNATLDEIGIAIKEAFC